MKRKMFSVIIVFVLIGIVWFSTRSEGSSPTIRDEIFNRLSAYYPMGNVTELWGGQHATDDSSSNRTTGKPCIVGSCRDFDGANDRWTIPNTIYTSGDDTLGACYYAQWDVTSGGPHGVLWIDKYVNFGSDVYNNMFRGGTYDGGWKTTNVAFTNTTNFHFICQNLYGNNTNLTVYKDGVYFDHVAVGTLSDHAGAGNFFGADSNYAGDMDGGVDEVAVFSDPVTPEMMRYMMENKTWFYADPSQKTIGDSCDTVNWNCSESCVVDSLNAGSSTITATGTGTIYIRGNITNINSSLALIIGQNCVIDTTVNILQ